MYYKTPFIWLMTENRVTIDRSLPEKIGLPLSIIEEWLDITFPPGSLKYEIMVTRAYDNAHGTHDSEKAAIFDIDFDLPWVE